MTGMHLQTFTLRAARTVSLLLLATLGTVMLMHIAPGYFAEEREMDARFGAEAQAEIAAEQQHEGTLLHLWAAQVGGMLHGDLGVSRQYQVPVAELLMPRLRVTARLVGAAVYAGSIGAFLAAVWCSGLRSTAAQRSITLLTALLICVPVSALATFCLLNGHGGPAIVLSAIVAARDFRFFSRLLRRARSAQHLAFARACGVRPLRLLTRHLLLPMRRELAALFAMSFVIALSAAIPVEVIFDVPGTGQLAWNAAMNRDLPVLFAITALLATAIATSTFVTGNARVPAEAP